MIRLVRNTVRVWREHHLRIPALLDALAGDHNRVVDTRHRDQRICTRRLGFSDLDRQILGFFIVWHVLRDLERNADFLPSLINARCCRLAHGVVEMEHGNAGWRSLQRGKHRLQFDKRLSDNCQGCRVVSEALRSHLRRARDVHDHRHFCRLAGLKRGDRRAGVPRADEHRAALPDQTLGCDTAVFRTALRVSMNNFDIETVFLTRKFRSEIDAAHTRLSRERKDAAARHDRSNLHLSRRCLHRPRH